MKMYRVYLYVFFFVTVVSRLPKILSDGRSTRSVFGSFFDPRPHLTLSSSTTCVGCTKKFTVVESDNSKIVVSEPEKYSITQEEFTALRIEYIKNQILKKLRLKEKPTVSLPKPLTENEAILPNIPVEDDMYDPYGDDFYGKTTRAIIFPYEGNI